MKPYVLLLICSFALRAISQEPAALKLTKTLALPGVKGRFDHFAIDGKGHRLFVAALGNDTLEVIDTTEGKRLKSIGGLHKPTGVLYLEAQNQIVVANGNDGTLKVFDGITYAKVKSLATLDDADNLRFDAKTKQLFLGYGDGSLAVIDATTMKQTGSIKLAAHPESFQLETEGSRIFVNLPDAKKIAVIDRDKQSVTATWPMEKFHSNFPMALDETNHRLFVGCRHPASLVVFDTATGRPVADLVLSGDTDDLFYDATLKRIYVSCGEGFLDVIEQRSADDYQRRERIPTRTGARTCFFSPSTGELYLAVPQLSHQGAELRVFQTHP
jgi:DNA-binding beta-propeller fold protein YncE